ncbi:MAG: hypothetical protein ACLU18_13170 [Bacteroides thetaiotaomicron]
MEYLKSWFRGFEQGIADLQPQQREVLFRACAVNCVHGGPFGLYRSLFEAAEGDLDRFFVKIDELDGVRGEIVCAGREYNLCFEACSCALHRAGVREYADVVRMFAAKLLYVMSELWPDRKFGVEVRASILRGADECVLNITVG